MFGDGGKGSFCDLPQTHAEQKSMEYLLKSNLILQDWSVLCITWRLGCPNLQYLKFKLLVEGFRWEREIDAGVFSNLVEV